MRSFFLQIFLSFWLVTVVIFVAATAFAPQLDPGNLHQLRVALDATVERLGRPAIKDYVKQGCAGIAWLPSGILIAGSNAQPLCGTAFAPDVEAQIRAAGQKKRALFVRKPGGLVQVSPFVSASGQQYFIVQTLPPVSRVWWPRLPPEALPISIVLTFLLSYFLTRPVRALSDAFRRFSAGGMEVRLPSPPSPWKHFGGADIHSLMSDFNHMADRICELVDAQKLLVRDVSHELRSPLARLQVALGIAREESPGSVEMLDHASSEADRLNVLIGELLTLSLMESMRQAPAPELFSVGEIFDLVMPDMKFEAEAHGASIAYGSACDKFLLRGHPEMLRRAFENVIRNAIRYTPQGECVSVTLCLSEARSDDGNSRFRTHRACEVSIEDNGPGVPQECLGEIFRPFYRVDMAREGTTGGFGIGLAIAERAITLHEGKISVQNRRNGGLIVRILLPEAHQ